MSITRLLIVALLWGASIGLAAGERINLNAGRRRYAGGQHRRHRAGARRRPSSSSAIKHGPFKTVDDLLLVKGIGEATSTSNRDRLTAATR